MEVLFISHKYPPATGGMEKFSFELINGMERHARVHKLVYEGIEPRWRWFFELRKRTRKILADHPGISVIHLNDGLMISFALWLKKDTKVPVVATLHGLDVVFPLSYYQSRLVPKFNRLDGIACVSRATRAAAAERGIDDNKLIVITNGVDHKMAEPLTAGQTKEDLFQKYGIDPKARILSGLGRAVKRKGYSWFVENVLPSLPKDVVFVMCGPISDYGARWWHQLLPASWVNSLALMMGHPTDEPALKSLAKQYPGRFVRTGHMAFTDIIQILKLSEAFVMPNIKVEGDMEGFGLVALEAILSGTVVFAAGHEGITDAIHDQLNGFLLPSGDVQQWVARLNQHLKNPKTEEEKIALQQYTLQHFSWEKMVSDYFNWFQIITKKG
ncbi:MAG TPA: glycosyltransferase family 4 protein [Saprospiraceae bacterium]|nr:glycosyltransferase family 4 protein [Saprospiraceae bacterium]HRG64434.1 glycosyltransferase family 4 protein [Saprospiraceae bacterium]